MKKVACCAVVGTLLLGYLFVAVDSADARAGHKKIWEEKYVSPGNPMDKALGGTGKANCHVCHAGKSRKNRNAYGQAISELIGKDEKDKDKLLAAFEQVAGQHSNPSDESSPTWGELIEKGTLPITKDEPAP
jgi:hypothetical protein